MNQTIWGMNQQCGYESSKNYLKIIRDDLARIGAFPLSTLALFGVFGGQSCEPWCPRRVSKRRVEFQSPVPSDSKIRHGIQITVFELENRLFAVFDGCAILKPLVSQIHCRAHSYANHNSTLRIAMPSNPTSVIEHHMIDHGVIIQSREAGGALYVCTRTCWDHSNN